MNTGRDWDILNATLQVCCTIPGTIKVQHIKSHQDRDTSTPETLPLPARLNILADAGTYKHIQTAPLSTKHPSYTPHQWHMSSMVSTLHQINSHLPLWPITHLLCQTPLKKTPLVKRHISIYCLVSGGLVHLAKYTSGTILCDPKIFPAPAASRLLATWRP